MYTLSLVSSVRIKFILSQVKNILMGEAVDYAYIDTHLVDANLTESQKRGLLALLCFILQSSVRFDVEADDLDQELQQLGSPHSHASTITRFYRANRLALKKFNRTGFQTYKPLTDPHCTADIIIDSSTHMGTPQGRVVLRIPGEGGKSMDITMTAEQADDLIRELKTVLDAMKDYA